MSNSIETQIHFEQLGIGNVLNRYNLSVPPNQRDYSWSDRHVTTLLQDFSQAITEDESGYFLGTIVTIPQKNILEVVDGQQRLATTTILIYCIYEYLATKEQELANSIRTDFLVGYDRGRKEYIPKLTLNLSDNDFFRARITNSTHLAEASRQSQHQIEDAFEKCRLHVKNIVSTFAEKDHADILNRWISFIQEKALVVLVRVTDEANAYKMFETLNDRGLKTSQSDLVKNHLFGKASERINEVQEKWALLRGALESMENEDITIDFLRHALTTTHGFVRENQVYESVQRIAKSAQTAVTFASNMENLSNIYVAIHNPEHERWNKYGDNIRRSIEVLNLFNLRQMRPLMLSIAAKFNEKDAGEAFKFLITLSVRILIANNSRSGVIEQAFATAARDVYSGGISSEIKTSLKSITPLDEAFALSFETATVSKMAWARYYLRSLEMAAKGEKEPWLIPNDDKQAINLEHILPRKPDNSWSSFTEDEVSVYANRLGNLALLQASKNSDLGSKDFLSKKEVYRQSPYLLTKQIAEADKWDKTTIHERQKVMAAYALKAWKI